MRKKLVFPLISLAISLIVLPFIGPLLMASLAVIVAALAYIAVFKRSS